MDPYRLRYNVLRSCRLSNDTVEHSGVGLLQHVWLVYTHPRAVGYQQITTTMHNFGWLRTCHNILLQFKSGLQYNLIQPLSLKCVTWSWPHVIMRFRNYAAV
jgi:hypothetical protein